MLFEAKWPTAGKGIALVSGGILVVTSDSVHQRRLRQRYTATLKEVLPQPAGVVLADGNALDRNSERDELVQARAQLDMAVREAGKEDAQADQIHEEIAMYHNIGRGSRNETRRSIRVKSLSERFLHDWMR